MKKFIIALMVVLALGSVAFGASEFDETWLVTADTTPEKVCLEHHLSRATLERCVRRYYIKWPRWM